MTNQTTNQNQSSWDAIDSILLTLAQGKKDMDRVFTPVYTCSKYDKNGFCESHVTDNEAFAAQCDTYELVSLRELNDIATSLGRVFEGVLLTNGGLCEYKKDKYTLLSDNLVYERYINHLCTTFHSNASSFFAWMIDVIHYSEDGWIMENLKKHIDNESKLITFYNHFCLKYEGDYDYLDQCCIDVILHYSKNQPLIA